MRFSPIDALIRLFSRTRKCEPEPCVWRFRVRLDGKRTLKGALSTFAIPGGETERRRDA